MRVSKRQLKRIIREEKNKLIAETRLRRTIRRVIREAAGDLGESASVAEFIVNVETSAAPAVPATFNPIGRRGIASSSATAFDAVPLISKVLLAYFIPNASCSVVIATLTSLPKK